MKHLKGAEMIHHWLINTKELNKVIRTSKSTKIDTIN
jgi:hypothetical protein